MIELIKQLVAVASPDAEVLLVDDNVYEFSIYGKVIGSLIQLFSYRDDPVGWDVSLVEHFGAGQPGIQSAEQIIGRRDTLPDAIRCLFQFDYVPSVAIETGVSGDDQQGGFINATMQHAGDHLTFSIATDLKVPEHVAAAGEAAVAEFVRDRLSKASTFVPGLGFRVQIGPNR